MRAQYRADWYAHNKEPREAIMEDTVFRASDYDDLSPHMQNFFTSVKSRQPVVEDAVFGNHAAIACHMANESYFRKGPVSFDIASKTIKG